MRWSPAARSASRSRRNAQIDEAFDTITYGKGGHVVAMIAGYHGRRRSSATACARYMAAHRYGNATSDDFFAAMAEAAGDPRIVPAMRSFTDQQGVPLLTFTRGRRAAIRSPRAAMPGLAPGRRNALECAAVRARGRRARSASCSIRRQRQLVLPGTGPLMPNAGGTGYYRFELPTPDWDALIAVADRCLAAKRWRSAIRCTPAFRPAGRARRSCCRGCAQARAQSRQLCQRSRGRCCSMRLPAAV